MVSTRVSTGCPTRSPSATTKRQQRRHLFPCGVEGGADGRRAAMRATCDCTPVSPLALFLQGGVGSGRIHSHRIPTPTGRCRSARAALSLSHPLFFLFLFSHLSPCSSRNVLAVPSGEQHKMQSTLAFQSLSARCLLVPLLVRLLACRCQVNCSANNYHARCYITANKHSTWCGQLTTNVERRQLETGTKTKPQKTTSNDPNTDLSCLLLPSRCFHSLGLVCICCRKVLD